MRQGFLAGLIIYMIMAVVCFAQNIFFFIRLSVSVRYLIRSFSSYSLEPTVFSSEHFLRSGSLFYL